MISEPHRQLRDESHSRVLHAGLVIERGHNFEASSNPRACWHVDWLKTIASLKRPLFDQPELRSAHNPNLLKPPTAPKRSRGDHFHARWNRYETEHAAVAKGVLVNQAKPRRMRKDESPHPQTGKGARPEFFDHRIQRGNRDFSEITDDSGPRQIRERLAGNGEVAIPGLDGVDRTPNLVSNRK
jgi:hypothetical protein